MHQKKKTQKKQSAPLSNFFLFLDVLSFFIQKLEIPEPFREHAESFDGEDVFVVWIWDHAGFGRFFRVSAVVWCGEV